MKLAVGPPWLRVTVTARDAELARKMAAHLAQAGAEETPEATGRVVTVEAAAEEDGPAMPESVREGNVFRTRREGSEGRYDLAAGRGEGLRMNGGLSGWWWFVTLVSGAVGAGILVYGIRQKDVRSIVFGAALSVVPMTVGAAWQSALIAAGLVLGFVASRRLL